VPAARARSPPGSAAAAVLPPARREAVRGRVPAPGSGKSENDFAAANVGPKGRGREALGEADCPGVGAESFGKAFTCEKPRRRREGQKGGRGGEPVSGGELGGDQGGTSAGFCRCSEDAEAANGTKALVVLHRGGRVS